MISIIIVKVIELISLLEIVELMEKTNLCVNATFINV